jgi:hypothetical protein
MFGSEVLSLHEVHRRPLDIEAYGASVHVGGCHAASKPHPVTPVNTLANVASPVCRQSVPCGYANIPNR